MILISIISAVALFVIAFLDIIILKIIFTFILGIPVGGISIDAIGKPGIVTFGRIARVGDEYVMQIAKGKAFKEKDADKYREALGFLNLPYAAIRLDGDPQTFVDNLRSQYMHICYDELRDKLLEVCRVLDIIPIVR